MSVNNFFERKREQKHKLHIKDLIVAIAEVQVDFSYYSVRTVCRLEYDYQDR